MDKVPREIREGFAGVTREERVFKTVGVVLRRLREAEVERVARPGLGNEDRQFAAGRLGMLMDVEHFLEQYRAAANKGE